MILTLIGYNHALAADPQLDVAVSHIQRALLETGPVKKTRKQLESYVKRKLDPPAWAATAIAVGISAVKDRKVSTSKFKNLGIKGGSENFWNLKPNVEYQFKGSTSGSLNFNLSY